MRTEACGNCRAASAFGAATKHELREFVVCPLILLGYNSQGKTIAYRNDVGLAQGQAAYGTSKPRPAKYGKEVCFKDQIQSIQAEEPNFPISFDIMNEIRAECGLPPEE